MASQKEQARAIIKDTTWCKDFSDDLLDALASKMVLVEAKDGHIFTVEGEPIKSFFILESGTLVRTKLIADDGTEEQEDMKSSIMHSRPSQVWDQLDDESVVVETITDRGRVMNIMHSMYTNKKAYATTVARGEARVWVMSDDDFFEIISNNANFGWQFMLAMSKEIRTGSKSLESLIRKTRGDVSSPDDKTKTRDVVRVLCYDSTSWVTDNFKPAIEEFNKQQNEKQPTSSDGSIGFHIVMDFTSDRLEKHSATHAAGYDAVCTFVNDTADADVIKNLSVMGVKMIAQRAAGFDRIDLKAARAYGITVARVPAYSPYAVAEHAITLFLTLNRKIHRAVNRVRMGNFSLDGGLIGMDIHGKTIGVMGTGKIGQILCNIILGFGANLVCYDVFENEDVKKAGGKYVTKDELYAQSDVIFLMMPLLKATYHTINKEVLPKLKKGVTLINTSRGGLIDTEALIEGMKKGIISGVGLDVYENEGEYFFRDWSGRQIKDENLAILLGLNNVVLTAHQAFFTKEAIDEIVKITLDNIRDFKNGAVGLKHPNNVIPPLQSDGGK